MLLDNLLVAPFQVMDVLGRFCQNGALRYSSAISIPLDRYPSVESTNLADFGNPCASPIILTGVLHHLPQRRHRIAQFSNLVLEVRPVLAFNVVVCRTISLGLRLISCRSLLLLLILLR